MTPIDWNNKSNARRGSWGRFGEPDESYSPLVHSLKLPKRRESFDGSDSSHSADHEKLQQPTFNSTMCSPTMMLASSANTNIPRSNSIGTFGRQGRLRRRSFRRPSFESIPSMEGNCSFSNSNSNSNATWNSNLNSIFDHDDDYLCQKAAHQHFLHHPQPALELDDTPAMPRRASTGTRLFQMQPALQDEKPRRVSISGPRPCMESSLASRDAPILRTRSFGTTRPCMEHTQCDRPILRPYRQLSSENLCVNMGCIGEETTEDLRSSRSNRSCLTSVVDLSSRTNRTGLVEFSFRSNRAGSIDFSTRSNRSIFRDFSTRSRTTAGPTEEPTSRVTNSLVVEEASISSASPLPAEPEKESWHKKTTMKLMEDNPNFRKNRNWPANLMRLLSIEQLALKDVCGEGNDRDAKHGVSNGHSNSPRLRDKRRLLRTIDIANEVMDGRRLVN